jgi:hypothetical protein
MMGASGQDHAGPMRNKESFRYFIWSKPKFVSPYYEEIWEDSTDCEGDLVGDPRPCKFEAVTTVSSATATTVM